MSHQPSTADQLKEKAKTAYDTIANTIAPASTRNESEEDSKKRNLTKDGQGQACKDGDFQDQLSNAARGKSNLKEEEETLIGKVSSSIPGVSTLQNSSSTQETAEMSQENTRDNGVVRPNDDVQVEEFLRAQYMSKRGKDIPSVEDED